MTIMKSSRLIISAFIIAFAVSVPAFAADKAPAAQASEEKSVFAAGVNYGLGDSGIGIVVDYSGPNAFDMPLVLRGFYHSANSNVNYPGGAVFTAGNVTYTNSVFGIADLYEFQGVADKLTPYVGAGVQFHNVNATAAAGTLTASGMGLFYTIGVKYNVASNIALDLSYNNAGQVDIGSVTSGGATVTLNPAFTTNAGGITLGALYSF